jgi:hypothetical protein
MTDVEEAACPCCQGTLADDGKCGDCGWPDGHERLEPLHLPPPIADDDDTDTLAISMDKPLRLSPDAIRALTKATGLTLTELLADDGDEGTRIQVMGFADLFRRYSRAGHLPDAATIWNQAARAYVPFVASSPPNDPLEHGSSTDSPDSVATGG